jgi:pimeloyl-ACP methyl ester carboxylesterase
VFNEPASLRPNSQPLRPSGGVQVETDGATTSDEATKTAIVCEDHQWDASSLSNLQALRTAMARVAPHMHLSTTGFKDVTGCLGWPHPVANPQHSLAVRGASPILMINSRFDVATPYAGARRAAVQIGHSATLLTYDGTSHVDYDETDCVRTAVDAYLISLTAVFPS